MFRIEGLKIKDSSYVLFCAKIKIFISQKIFIFNFFMIISFILEENGLKIFHIVLRKYLEEIASI